MEENRPTLAAANYSKQIVAQIGAVNDAYFESFPPGIRFCPTKKDLINYLKGKVFNEPLPANRIREVNLYQYHPRDLIRMYKLFRETECYFFTPRDRKYPKGSRPNRAAADGYWKPTGKDTSIAVDTIRGFRKSLDYYEGKHPTGKKTHWKMHEYRLHEDIAPPNKKGVNGMKLDEWVLCRVYEKSRNKKKDKINDESIETKTLDEMVSVTSATSQSEGDSTLNIEPNSLEVHGSNSGAISYTTWNNSLSCCDYACEEPLQHQPFAYCPWDFTDQALPNYNIGIADMWLIDAMQSLSSQLPTHVGEDNQLLEAPENGTFGSKEDNKEV